MCIRDRSGTEFRIEDSTGNVGIGTSAPGQKLTVAGNISACGGVCVKDSITLGGNIFKNVENSFLGLYGGSDTLTNDGFIKLYGNASNWGKVQTNIGYDASNSKAHWTLNNTTELMTLQGNGCLGIGTCLLYTSPSPRDRTRSRMPSSA